MVAATSPRIDVVSVRLQVTPRGLNIALSKTFWCITNMRSGVYHTITKLTFQFTSLQGDPNRLMHRAGQSAKIPQLDGMQFFKKSPDQKIPGNGVSLIEKVVASGSLLSWAAAPMC